MSGIQRHNDFNNVFRGVEINGNAALYTEVSQNNICLKPDNVFNMAQHGVKLTACLASNTGSNYTTVHGNNAVGSGTATPNPLESLFYASMNTGTNSPRLTCNEASEAYAGFTFHEFNGNAKWAGNIMQPLIRGLVLTDFGEIGQQGDANVAPMNVWDGTWNGGTHYGTYVANSSTAGLSPIYFPSLTLAPINNDGNVPVGDRYSTFNGNLLAPTSGGFNCIGIPNNIVLPVPDFDKYGDAAQYSIVESMVYRMLHLDPDIIGPDDELYTYYNSLSASNTAAFMNIERELFENDYSSARTINNDIEVADENACEHAYKAFYDLYANYLEVREDSLRFSEADSIALRVLATSCPAHFGPAVYQAQALYNHIYPSAHSLSECEGESQERRKFTPPALAESLEWKISIAPNPFGEYITVYSSSEDEKLHLQVTDLAGRQIFQASITLLEGKSDVNLPLEKGMYFITMTNALGKTKVQKLICDEAIAR